MYCNQRLLEQHASFLSQQSNSSCCTTASRDRPGNIHRAIVYTYLSINLGRVIMCEKGSSWPMSPATAPHEALLQARSLLCPHARPTYGNRFSAAQERSCDHLNPGLDPAEFISTIEFVNLAWESIHAIGQPAWRSDGSPSGADELQIARLRYEVAVQLALFLD